MFRIRLRSLSFVSMPTYDFRCPNGHEFEHFFRKISEATAELACPQCGATAERRVSGGAGLVFKGSGFYLTDYGRNAHRKAAPGKASNESKGAEAKSDTKPESPKAESSASGSASDSASSAKPESSPATGAANKRKASGE